MTTTRTLAQAQMNFEEGVLAGAAIYFHEWMGHCFYSVSFESALDVNCACPLVCLATGEVCRFETMDAAHAAIRQVGFRSTRFWVSSK